MNRALLGAIRKGAAARAAGEPRSSCPYHDTRKLDGRLTWGRAFRRAWFDGYDGAFTKAEIRAMYPTLAQRAEDYAKRAGTPRGLSTDDHLRTRAAIVLAYAAGFRAGRKCI